MTSQTNPRLHLTLTIAVFKSSRHSEWRARRRRIVTALSQGSKATSKRERSKVSLYGALDFSRLSLWFRVPQVCRQRRCHAGEALRQAGEASRPNKDALQGGRMAIGKEGVGQEKHRGKAERRRNKAKR